MEANGATFSRSDLPFSSTIKLRTEAATQNVTNVKAWYCLAQCYVPSFLDQGGTNIEDQFVQIGTNPFEDTSSIAAMKRYLTAGGPQSEVGLEAYSAGLLFKGAAKQVVLSDGKNGLAGSPCSARSPPSTTSTAAASSARPRWATGCRTAAS